MIKFLLKGQLTTKNDWKYRLFIEDDSAATAKITQSKKSTESKIIKTISRHKSRRTKRTKMRYITLLYGWRLTIVEPFIKEIIKYLTRQQKKFDQVTLNGEIIKNVANQIELILPEESGVKLALIFRTVSRIQKMSKVDNILLNVKSMNHEEAYYWYSKLFSGRNTNIAARAFRLLMSI